jgi:hypothetical protein
MVLLAGVRGKRSRTNRSASFSTGVDTEREASNDEPGEHQSLRKTRTGSQPWLDYYNYDRKHSSLGRRPPISRVSPT